MAYDNVCKYLIESYPEPYLRWLLCEPLDSPPEILKTELPVEPSEEVASLLLNSDRDQLIQRFGL